MFIEIHIIIFLVILYISVKLHGNNFLNTIALSVMLSMIMFLLPALLYSCDNSFVNSHVLNKHLNINLLYYIESYYLVFLLFSINFFKLPSYSFNIPKTYIFPVIYILLSIIHILLGHFYLDVTNSSYGSNEYYGILSLFTQLSFILGLYTLVNYKNNMLIYFLLYYILYTGLSGSKGGLLFVFIFILIYYFQEYKIFCLKNIKYLLIISILLPSLFFVITFYRGIYDFQGNGSINNSNISTKIVKSVDNFHLKDIYYSIIKRVDQASVMQMAYNNYNYNDFLEGASYIILPNYFLPSFIFKDKVKVSDYYGTQLTEKVFGEKVGYTVIGLSPPVEAYINFSFFGILVGAVHGLVYNILFQLLNNKKDNNFMIAYYGISFFIISDTFLTTSLAYMLKELFYLIITLSIIRIIFIRKIHS